MSYTRDLKEIAEYHVGIVEELCDEGGRAWDEIKLESWKRLQKSAYWRGDLKTNTNYIGMWGNMIRPFERKHNAETSQNGNGTLTYRERMGAQEFIIHWFHTLKKDVLPATFEALAAAAGYTAPAYNHGITKLREMGYEMELSDDGTYITGFWRVVKRPKNTAKQLAEIAGKLPKDDQDTLLSIIEDLLNSNK